MRGTRGAGGYTMGRVPWSSPCPLLPEALTEQPLSSSSENLGPRDCRLPRCLRRDGGGGNGSKLCPSSGRLDRCSNRNTKAPHGEGLPCPPTRQRRGEEQMEVDSFGVVAGSLAAWPPVGGCRLDVRHPALAAQRARYCCLRARYCCLREQVGKRKCLGAPRMRWR